MRWNQESLSKVRAVILVAVGIAILFTYLISRS